MNWIISVPLLCPIPVPSLTSSLHIASSQTSHSSGTLMILAYFAMVSLVTMWTTTFIIFISPGRWKVSATSWRHCTCLSVYIDLWTETIDSFVWVTAPLCLVNIQDLSSFEVRYYSFAVNSCFYLLLLWIQVIHPQWLVSDTQYLFGNAGSLPQAHQAVLLSGCYQLGPSHERRSWVLIKSISLSTNASYMVFI